MAITKISEATSVGSLAGTEKFPISDGTSSAKSATIEDIKDYIAVNGASYTYNDATSLASFLDGGKYKITIDANSPTRTFDFRSITGASIEVTVSASCKNEQTFYYAVGTLSTTETVSPAYMNEENDDDSFDTVLSIQNNVGIYGAIPVEE